MESAEISKKIKRIEIQSKALSENIFSGEYHAAFKGRGMAFSEVRPYQFGDDIRSIDWNVTARHRTPYIKVFEEERELTLFFVIDVSGSSNFGGTTKTKLELATDLLGVLLFSALANNDRFGAVFISDRIEQFIPISKGKKHALYILHQLLSLKPKGNMTDLRIGAELIKERIKKRSITFIISDFIDENNFLDSYKWIAKKHDLIALHTIDRIEEDIPNIGIIQMFDSETNQRKWVDTRVPEVRRFLSKQVEFRTKKLNIEFRKMGAEYLQFRTAEDFVKPLYIFFKNR